MAPSPMVEQIAQLILDGFDIHYRKFIKLTLKAKGYFEQADWQAIQQLHSKRISQYDKRVVEAIDVLKERIAGQWLQEPEWHEVKIRYQEMLLIHPQPELAESFYNSVYCRLFDRRYYHNDHIFVESRTDWQHYDQQEKIYRRYHFDGGLKRTIRQMLNDLDFSLPFENQERDISHILAIFSQQVGTNAVDLEHLTVDVLTPIFYRNKAAYVVGRLIHKQQERPFIVPILNNGQGQLYADALLLNQDQMAIVFGFARSYFFANTQSPLLLINFLHRLLPHKSKAELYTSIGLQKHGKTLFYRDFLHHLERSDDQFSVAPGIRGMVMAVFTLPSFPYVFKVIKDRFAPQKDMSRDMVKHKYQLVKEHDRVGRMADTWEYSHVAFPKERFSPELLAELKETIPSNITEDQGQIIIGHCYIERRMVPLNIYLETASHEQTADVLAEYGDAIKELTQANIFPGDMLLKNFGVTRHGRVIFYDYDEIMYTTDCNFRRIPPPRYPEDEFAAEPWYSVGPADVFPEEFPTFLFNEAKMRKTFCQLHGDLLTPDFWQACQQKLNRGEVESVYPYDTALRVPRGLEV